MKTLKISALVGAALLVAPTAMASSILIDDFDVAQRVQDLPNGFPNISTVTNEATIFGGSRTLSVVTSPSDANANQPIAGSVLESTGTSALPSAETLKFSNDDGQTGLATVIYNGGGNGLGDLTNGGLLDKFFFEILTADLAGTIFTTTVEDAAANSGTFTENVGPAFDPFLSFLDPAFVGVNFEDVASLTFTFNSNGVASFDGSLGSISVVPLPLSAFLLLGGLGGLVGVSAASKRRRKA